MTEKGNAAMITNTTNSAQAFNIALNNASSVKAVIVYGLIGVVILSVGLFIFLIWAKPDSRDSN
jgi:hypothetical protein